MTNHEKTHDTTNLTLVLGGTGKSGRRVAEPLQAHGVPVRIGPRLLKFADVAEELAKVTAAKGVWSA